MDKEDLKYIEQGLLDCNINDDLGEKLLNEKFANNIDKDILNIIKDPKSETNFGKCSKSAAIRLVIAYNNPKYKDIKLCLGYISPKGNEGISSINHAWVEIDGKTYESNVPSGDYKRVLVDELVIDRNEDLYNQVEEFLNKSNLQEDLGGSNEVDSEGNPLTPEQVEFFKNSKVRDDMGRLLVCFHSTNNDFDEFKYETFFTPNKQFSLGYGDKTKECYLNLEKPFIIDYDKLWDFVEAHDNGEDYFENELDIVNEFGINTPDLYFTLLGAYDFGNDTSYYDVIDAVQGEGDYDGIILYNSMMNAGIDTQIVAFYPNQIKSIDNKNPSNSNNINEDLSLTNNVQKLIDKLKEYNIELVGGKELHNDYSLTLKNKDNNATRKVKVAKDVKPTKSYCDYLKDYFNSLQETQKLYNIKEYYHGSPSKELDEEINSTLWFTDDIIYAMRYGENIFTCDLSVNNPLNIGDTNKYIRGLMPNTFSQEFIDIAKALNVEPKKLLHIDEDARKIYTIVRTKEFKDLCIKNGYDAIQTIEEDSICYGIFDLNQVKINDIDLG